MITNINKFLLLENIQQAKAYLNKQGIKNPDDDMVFKLIKNKLEPVPNLIGHFVKLAFEDENAMAQTLDDVMDWIVNHKDLTGQLPKNINQYTSIEKLDDDIKDLERKTLIKKFYKSLYKSMRDSVDKLDESKRKEFNDLALSFMELKEETKKNFTPLKYFEKNNISIEEFMEALRNFIDKETVNDDKKAVLEKLKKHEGKYKIKYNKDNVLVIQSNDKETICDLGSQNWCIVYSPDTYADSYYGPGTNNTQFIVYNFNLPSSSANSMFGVTINEEGETRSGGSQNKRNEFVPLDKIYELTGIPYGTLSPTEEIKKRIQDKEKIKQFFRSDNLDLTKLYNIYKENDIDKDIFNFTLDKYDIVRNYDKKILFDTFKDKTTDDVIKILNNEFISDNIFAKYDKYNLFIYALNIDNTDISHLIILNMFDNMVDRKIKNMLSNIKDEDLSKQLNDDTTISEETLDLFGKSFMSGKIEQLTSITEDYQKIIDKLSLDQNKIENLYNKLSNKRINSNKMWEIVKKIFDNIKNEFINYLMSYENNTIEFESFNQYKSLYDKYILPKEETPYESILEDYNNIDILTANFYDDENYKEFLSNILEENNDINKSDIIKDLIVNDTSDEYYLLEKSGYSQLIIDVIKKINVDLSDVIKSDNVTGLFLYKNLDKYDKEFKNEIGIETTENGIDYVEVSDFTSFDDLIFDQEYFNSMEDLSYFEWFDVDDYTLEEYYDYLDDYNIITIAHSLMKEVPELNKFYSTNTVRENLIDSENIIIKDKPIKVPKLSLMNQYNSTENLTKLKKDLKKIIFDIEDLNIEDADVYEDTINDIIKQEMLHRTLMYAYEGVQYDYVFNALVDAVGDHLGGSYWPKDEEEIPMVQGNSIYKFKNNRLLFTVDLDYLIENIKSYSDFNYNYGDNFDWEQLLSYVAKELTSPINMERAFEKASMESPDKKTYNEAFRNL